MNTNQNSSWKQRLAFRFSLAAVAMTTLSVLCPSAAHAADGKPAGPLTPPAQKPAQVLKSLQGKGRLVFESYRNDNWDLYTSNADGSDLQALTETPDRHELYPHVSPDGKMICFVVDEESDEELTRSVYVMNLDGTDLKKVASNARQPCWDPTGQTIAYLKGEYEKFSVLDYVSKGMSFYDVDTGATRDHVNPDLHHLYNITWAGNGDWLLATVHGGMGYGHAILAIEANGKRVVDLKIGGCRPDLNASGEWLAWGRTDNVISVGRMDWASDEPKVVDQKDVVVEETMHIYHVDWSPDSQFLSYSRGPGGRVLPDGPGTHKGVAEFVGCRAEWDLCVMPLKSGVGWVQVTQDGLSNKESDWYSLD